MRRGTVPELSMKPNVHAECTVLAYHLQHPESMHTIILADRNFFVMDVAASIASQNLLVSSPKPQQNLSTLALAFPTVTGAANVITACGSIPR
jgi:hypothetical protein